jgi:hypothetical protein
MARCLCALGEYFRTRHFAQRPLTGCLAPVGAVIWTTPSREIRTLRTKELLRAFFTLPLVTLKVMMTIHWEALQLWLQGARLVPKDAVLNTGLATAKTNVYTSPALSTRAKD